MDKASFAAWLDGIRGLTAEQRRLGSRGLALAKGGEGAELAEFASPASGEAAAPSTIGGMPSGAAEREGVQAGTAPDGAVSATAATVSLTDAAPHKVALSGCPHCASRQLHRWGSASGLPRYRCDECGRTFNALTGTPLAHLRKKEQWPAQTQAMIEGESLVKTAQRCEVAVTTVLRWRRRFRSALALDAPNGLHGIAKADETAILESFKGRLVASPSPARKRGGRTRKKGQSGE